MGRIIGSVIAAYVTMFAIVFVLMSLAWLALGASGAFQVGSWDVSGSWLVVSVIVGLAAAISGGMVSVGISQDRRALQALIGLIIVMGALSAWPAIAGAGEAMVSSARPDTVSMFDAMSNIRQPVWVALLNPVLGIVGVIIGARWWRARSASREGVTASA